MSQVVFKDIDVIMLFVTTTKILKHQTPFVFQNDLLLCLVQPTMQSVLFFSRHSTHIDSVFSSYLNSALPNFKKSQNLTTVQEVGYLPVWRARFCRFKLS